MTVGDPMDASTRLGAIVSEEQLDRVMAYVDAGRDEGARLVAGGERTSVNGTGHFVTATGFAGAAAAFFAAGLGAAFGAALVGDFAAVRGLAAGVRVAIEGLLVLM